MALLWGLAAAVLAAGTYAWQSGRPLPALLATAAAALVLLAWRMSGDLDPVAIWIEGTYLVIQTRRHLLRRAVSGAPVRRLEKNEIDHLQQLASTGVFMTTAGGFDSRHLGEFDLFASNLDNAVLVDLGDERIIITPDEPERFVATLNG